MSEPEMYRELIHGLKFCRTDKVKDIVASKICQCLIDDHKYCNRIQMEICDALADDQVDFIDKYGAYIRECLDEDQTIDEILLNLTEKIDESMRV